MMSTLTKEWLQQTIAELEEERDATPGAVNEDVAMALAAMKLALASLEAKDKIPELRQVIYHFRDWNEGFPVERFKADYVISWMLANYPPAQPTAVSVPDGYRLQPISEYDAMCAAMLQGAEPVTTTYTLPANTPCKDAPEHIWLQTAGVWPENGEFSELTWCSDNQHQDDTLYVRADVVTGNSPVIPDGWVSCSERMPEDEQEVIVQNKMGYRYVSYFDEHSGLFFDMRGGNQMNCIEHIFVTHWMPMPAAPQQEVKP
ncbi:DUF551 domain-containing protein [Enterobacter hormaechei]|nr:DUF551 domain-containing protein [Enterobacter hormaechei]MCU3675795.1 DUF551 domain-containing protein [Enterobacter hormaechei subsp. oharae]MDU4097684.1 DUF551 domain-containing protein [Enterobacter hormaechei]